jgi:Ca2+-binding EF-hand superfamily protein
MLKNILEIYDDLIKSEQIKGQVVGGRQSLSAVFVPEFFTKAQRQYVEAFLRQNGYIDYSSLKKIGITEPDSYVKALFNSTPATTTTQDIEYFTSSCFMRYFLDQIEQDIDENLNRTGICDLSVK